MSKQLQQQLDRLQQDHPIVKRHAVAGIFQLLAQHSMYTSKVGQDALQLCLRQTHQVTIRPFVGSCVTCARCAKACINLLDHRAFVLDPVRGAPHIFLHAGGVGRDFAAAAGLCAQTW